MVCKPKLIFHFGGGEGVANRLVLLLYFFFTPPPLQAKEAPKQQSAPVSRNCWNKSFRLPKEDEIKDSSQQILISNILKQFKFAI